MITCPSIAPLGGGFNATLMTAVAAQAGGGATVEVRVTTSADGVRRMRLYVNGVVSDHPGRHLSTLPLNGAWVGRGGRQGELGRGR